MSRPPVRLVGPGHSSPPPTPVTGCFFFGVLLVAASLSLSAADRVVLWVTYGPERVARDGLTVVSSKPVIKVSNGDVLRRAGFPHFLVCAALWLAVAMPALFFGMRLLPRRHRGGFPEGAHRHDPEVGPLQAALHFLPLVLVVVLVLTLGSFRAGVALVGLSLAVGWVTPRWFGRPGPADPR